MPKVLLEKALDLSKLVKKPIIAMVGGKPYLTHRWVKPSEGRSPRKELRDTQGRLLAPNGKPSNLTEAQWHMVRTPEFKRWFGDWERAQDKASCAVDKNGEPRVFYHGTRQNFTVFDPLKLGAFTGANSAKQGFFVSSDPDVASSYPDGQREAEISDSSRIWPRVESAQGEVERAELETADAEYDEDEKGWLSKVTRYDSWGVDYTDDDGMIYDSKQDALDAAFEEIEKDKKKAEKKLEEANAAVEEERQHYSAGARIIPLFINIRNPLVHDYSGGDYTEQSFTKLGMQAKEDGSDGVAFYDVDDDALGRGITSDIFMVFDPHNLKSALGNDGSFDITNPDIQKALDTSKLVKTPVMVRLDGKVYQSYRYKRPAKPLPYYDERDLNQEPLKKEPKATVYQDSLGNPEYMGTISVFGAQYGKPGTGYLAFSTTSNAPRKRWPYESKDVSSIVDEMNREGWDCEVIQDGHGAPLINCEHRATRSIVNSLKAKHDEKWKDAKDVYVRFGDIPKGGFSTDWSSGRKEKGVSVFRGKILQNGEILTLPYTNQELGSLLTMNDRPLYVIEGEEVGMGADGEPVLSHAKQYKPKDAAKKLFESEATDEKRSENQKIKTIEDVDKAWESMGVESHLYEGSGGIIILSKIVVPKEKRRKGIGTAAMNILIDYADRMGKQIALTPSGDFGGNKARLNQFYRGFGFRAYKGFTVREKLIRDPVVNKSLTFSGWKLQDRSKVHGMDISIENKKGSVRRGKDKDGHAWATKMHADYGYIRGTVGKDKDHLDCYVGPNPESTRVFIIHQNDPTTGRYDEDKIILAVDTAEEAKALYMKQYDRPGFFGSMDETDIETFKAKAFADSAKGKKLVIKSLPGDWDHAFYAVFYAAFADKDGHLNAFGNCHKLKDLKGFPEGLDLENCDIIRFGKDRVYFSAGGDWQHAVKFAVAMKGGKLVIAERFYETQPQKRSDIRSSSKQVMETFAGSGKKLVVKAMKQLGSRFFTEEELRAKGAAVELEPRIITMEELRRGRMLTEKDLKDRAKRQRDEKLIERDYPDELAVGVKVEMEHTDDPAEARKIAFDHLIEDRHYYKKLLAADLVDESEAIEEARKVGLKKSIRLDSPEDLQKPIKITVWALK